MFDNNDPKGLGRIRVKMGWQNEKGEATPWIQVISPHGGGGKGFHFIPEKGEKVMVDFQGGNAELPYVIGNLFNTNARIGFKSKSNDIKTIRSRSGHTLLFNDNDKNPSIVLTDRNKNLIYIDTINNQIHISSNNQIMISSDNIELAAKENLILGAKRVSISAGSEMTHTSRKNIIYSDNIDFQCDNLDINAYKNIKINSTEETILNNKNLKNVSVEKTEIESENEINLTTKNINQKKK